MNNDVWYQQQHNGNSRSQQNGTFHSGSLLDYHQQGFQQYSPTSMPPTQGPPSYSPMPQQYQPPQQQGWPAPQSWPSSNQGWVASTMQMVRSWSGKIASVPPVDQNPLILYKPNTPLPPQKSK